MRRNTQFIMLIALILALLTSAIRPYSVYADGVTTPEPPTEETTVPETPPAEEVTTPEPSAEEATIPETSATEPIQEVTVTEVLQQAPEGTTIVVVNEEGQAEPLVTETAAEIITTSDPMWCPEGVLPGGAGCTASFSDFASLLTELNSGSYTGNGVIWVEDSYNGNDDSQIEFDGNVLTNLANNNLTVQGGWDGVLGGNNITGTSSLDVSMVFVNWNGNITLNDLDITATDNAGFGLFVNNTGNVALENVSVNNTTANSFGFGDGAVINTTGDVDITDSEFNGNSTDGLQVASGGTVELNSVSASNNSLTGAYIDSCLYNNSTGFCAGNGSVTIEGTTNLFNNNGFNGLVVDSGGDIALENTQANGNDLDGAVLTSADDDGTGDVYISSSQFSDNQNGSGLDVLSSGNIDVDNVTANNNGTGAVLDSTYGTGYVNVNDSTFGNSNTTGNMWTGLHIESGSTITLNDVIASYNGTNGAYLTAQGNIDVTNGTFNNNVQFNYPQDPGLYAQSNGGNITLTNVVANDNQFGAGAVALTNGTGNVLVSGTSQFNGNGTFGIQVKTYHGDITLTDVEANDNASKGAYLNAYGHGNIFIYNGLFEENSNYGIYATSSEGDIEVHGTTVTGNDVTNTGAYLSGVNVFISNSNFQSSNEAGVVIVANEQVDLVNVTADQNGSNGVEIYTADTYACKEPDADILNIVVNVDGGTFTSNADYGLSVMPGPEGTLVFINPATFGGNGLGDYLLDITAPTECEEEPIEETEPSNPNVVQVPFTGGDPVEQDCELFDSTILELPNGTWVQVGCPYEGFSNLEGLLEEDLPAPLGAGVDFISGISTSLTDEEGNTILNDDGTFTITFKIPEDSRARSYSILFWDETLNDGAGGWVKLPVYEFGTSFPLHPDNPDDGRVIVSGVQEVDDTVTVTVNFSGIFILVTP